MPTPTPTHPDAADVVITSFGYLHAPPPEAHLTVDLREHFRDLHVSPALRHLTARDAPVRAAVRATPGIDDLLAAVAAAVLAYQAGPSRAVLRVAVGCAGGRHRAAVFAGALEQRLREAALSVRMVHRDLDKPVVDR